MKLGQWQENLVKNFLMVIESLAMVAFRIIQSIGQKSSKIL